MAWCIVPFDAKKRRPEERAAMLEKLGIRLWHLRSYPNVPILHTNMRASLVFEAVCRLAGLSLLFGASISCLGATEAVLTNQPLQTITHTGQSPNPANPAAGGAALGKDAIACLTQLKQLPLLSRPENAAGLPVRFEGTVLFANPAQGLIALRDDTATAIVDYDSVGEPIHSAEKIRLEGIARMVAGRAVFRRAWSIDSDGLHPRSEKQATLRLKAGPHPLRVDWFNAAEKAVLEVHLGRAGLSQATNSGFGSVP